MGLDINFRLDKALDAGLETKITVEDYRAQSAKNQQQLATLGTLKAIGFWFEISVITSTNGELIASIRANKWGPLFAPLTAWLKSNEIEWYET